MDYNRVIIRNSLHLEPEYGDAGDYDAEDIEDGEAQGDEAQQGCFCGRRIAKNHSWEDVTSVTCAAFHKN